MATEDDDLSPDERVERSVTRTLAATLLLVGVTGALGAWFWFLGSYEIYPGQAAIVTRLGAYQETVSSQGLKFHLPWPIGAAEIVEVGELRKIEFGVGGVKEGATSQTAIQEASMQTKDNAIVRLSFVVQYRISDAYQSRYSLEDPEAVLRDAAQASVREVVGRMTIEDVLSERRDDVASETAQNLQATIDKYQAGIQVTEVQLQEVQPPEEVREAFDDVVAASQDANRAVNEAEGYRNELQPKARAEAAEIIARANAYREAKIAESHGESERFVALQREYRKAPEITRKRLYLEMMEAVLPKVETVVIEQGTSQVLPFLPIGGYTGGGAPAGRPAAERAEARPAPQPRPAQPPPPLLRSPSPAPTVEGGAP